MPPRLSDATADQLQRFQVNDLMRCLSARAFARGAEAEYFRQHWPGSLYRDVVVKHFEAPYETKAAVGPGTTTGADWAAPLMVPALLDGFLPLVRAASVFATLPVTPAPFNTRLARQTAGSSTKWIGENVTKPVSKLGFGNLTLPWSKALSVVVVTAELMKLAAPGSAEQLSQTLKDEVTNFVDSEFLSANAAVAGVNPAGILNGVTPITATASLAADLAALVAAFFTARPRPFAPWFVLSPVVVAKVAALDMGRDVTVNGGTLLGLPVAVGSGAASNAILVDAPAIYLADGGIDLDVSDEAIVQMNDAPDSPGTAATVQVSLWQNNLVGIRAERFIHWIVAAANSVQFLVVA